MLDLHAIDLSAMDRHTAEREIRARVQTVPVGDGLVLSRVLGRHKMLLRTDDKGFGRHVMLDGYWEIWLTLFFTRVLKPGMTAFDVGANFGYYTLLFGDCVGLNGSVVAIEPNQRTFAVLTDTVALNGFAATTLLVQAAAWDRIGEDLPLFVPAGEPKNATTAFPGGSRPAEAHGSVPSVTIDSLAAPLSRVDLIKIDVEGAEPAVLRGMMDTVRRHKPMLILEYNVARYTDPAAVLSDLVGVYGEIMMLDFAGDVRVISREELLGTRHGEDWLLCFGVPTSRAPYGRRLLGL